MDGGCASAHHPLFKRQSAGGLGWLAQIPIFVAMYHVLRHVANSANLLGPSPQLSLYSFTPRETPSAAHATLFGAALSSTGTLLPMVTVVLVSAAACCSTG